MEANNPQQPSCRPNAPCAPDARRAWITRLGIAIAAAPLCILGATAMAAYPEHPIKLVVPFPPGGPNDMMGRILAAEMGKDLGQTVVVDNRAGAGGTIGTDAVAKAAPDGYTLLLSGTASLSIAPSLYSKLPYDAVADFTPIGLAGTSPSLLVVNKDVPFHNVRELIAYAKAHPGKLAFASAGVGTPPHLAGELFKAMADVDILHVPYKGGGPALTDLIAGQVQLYFAGILAVSQPAKQGTLRGLAVTSATRTDQMPDVPTMAEAGLPGYEVQNWFAIVAPRATPPAVVQRLNTSLVKVLGLESVKTRMRELGLDPFSSTPGELADYQKKELEKWAGVVKKAGIQPE